MSGTRFRFARGPICRNKSWNSQAWVDCSACRFFSFHCGTVYLCKSVFQHWSWPIGIHLSLKSDFCCIQIDIILLTYLIVPITHVNIFRVYINTYFLKCSRQFQCSQRLRIPQRSTFFCPECRSNVPPTWLIWRHRISSDKWVSYIVQWCCVTCEACICWIWLQNTQKRKTPKNQI